MRMIRNCNVPLLRLGTGQTHVQQHMPALLDHISKGRLSPDVIISHRLPLADAVRGYELFDKKLEDCRKVVLTQ